MNKNNLSDEELLECYRHTGNNQYWEAIYTRYYDKVLWRCTSYIKDPIRAQDLTQDIFLKLIGKINSFQQQAKFSTWFHRFILNYCYDQVYTKRNHPVISLAEAPQAYDIQWEDESVLVADEKEQHLQAAFKGLDLKEQLLLTLKYDHQLSVRVIALQTGLTECAVRMRLKRCRDKLRKRYLDLGPCFVSYKSQKT
jgi:RNA polymerase sigma factor (sigma-70 family)